MSATSTTPALFSHGFRPFFLGAGIWAVLIMLIWIGSLHGFALLNRADDPAAWHAHAFLFGYIHAAIAGFLLTAVPNWTGRPPLGGLPLAALFALWVAGRLTVFWVSFTPSEAYLLAASASVAMPLCLAGFILREIVSGKNWRNLPVLALITLFGVADALFWFETATSGAPAQGLGLRLGLMAILMLVALIGGRIVPTFTRNWLKQRGVATLPPTPMQPFDKLAVLSLLIALALWTAQPDSPLTGAVLLLSGGLHILRLARWQGHRTLAEPLVWVLHAGYAFVPLGALAMGAALLTDHLSTATAQHVWMAGALGLMTLAVMTRAALGHSGRALHAGPGTALVYLCLIAAVLLRVAANLWPGAYTPLIALSGIGWLCAFAGFTVLYAPILTQPRKA